MKTTLNLFIVLLLSLGLVSSTANAQNAVSANDTLLIKFGDKSKMMILLDEANDLKNLKRYDINALIVELDSMISNDKDGNSEFYISSKQGKVFLKDTTIAVSGVEKNKENVVTTQIRMGDIFNLEINHDTARNVIEVNDLKKEKKVATAKISKTSDDEDEDDNEVDDADQKDKKKSKYKNPRYRNYFNIDLGLNNYLQNGKFPDAEGENYGLKPTGSRYVALGLNQKVRLGGKSSRLSLHTGLHLNWYNFMLQDNVQFVRGAGSVEVVAPMADRKLEKSKLTASYINVPAMLVMDFRQGSKKGFSLGVGGYAGYRIGSHTKIKYEENGRTRKDKDYNNFYLNNWRYGITTQIGFRGIDLFANYDLNNLFAEKRGPNNNNLNAFSFGIRL